MQKLIRYIFNIRWYIGRLIRQSQGVASHYKCYWLNERRHLSLNEAFFLYLHPNTTNDEPDSPVLRLIIISWLYSAGAHIPPGVNSDTPAFFSRLVAKSNVCKWADASIRSPLHVDVNTPAHVIGCQLQIGIGSVNPAFWTLWSDFDLILLKWLNLKSTKWRDKQEERSRNVSRLNQI